MRRSSRWCPPILRIVLLVAVSTVMGPAIQAAPPAKKTPAAKAPLAAPPRLSPLAASKAPPSVLPPDTELQRIVDDRVASYKETVGLVVGVIEPAGRRVFVRGPAQIGNDDSVDGDTIYEIGGIAKVFTALLLTDMARRGELSLKDPVAKYLPPGTTLPTRSGKVITLLDLATHTSGLPRMPANVAVTDFNNPNADMNVDQLLKAVGAYELTRDIGTGYEYSNAGFDLLALAEATAGHTDYETLLKSRIFGPLHMANTRISPSLDEKDHLSSGYDSHLGPVPHAKMPTLLGADGMRSTANDLLDFLAANIGLVNTPLAPAMAEMVSVRRPTQYLELSVALGWHVATLHGVEMIWENGRAEGYRAFIGFAPKLRTGVVVLSNSANTIDDIAAHILDKDTPLKKLRREADILPSSYENYTGRYAVSDTFSLSVTREGSHLYIQGTGQPRAELYSLGDNQFFLRVVDAQVLFQTDSSGRANSLSLTQDGKTIPAFLVQ